MITKNDLLKRKRITNVSFHIGFEPVSRVEKYMYELERDLKKQFPDDVVDTKVPYGFAPQAPRFLLRNTKKQRFLEISLVGAKLRMKIVDDYSREIDKGLAFFKSQVEIVFGRMKGIINPIFDKFGGIYRIEYSTLDFPQINPEKFFCERFLNYNVKEPYIYTFKLVYIEDDKYFVNYSSDIFTKIKGELDLTKVRPIGSSHEGYVRLASNNLREAVVQDKGITITLDINNKFTIEGVSPTLKEVEPNVAINEIFQVAKKRIDSLEEFLL